MTPPPLPSLQPSLAEFHSAFQVVFVDPSGHLNMCADMTSCTYKQVNIVNKILLCVPMRSITKRHGFTIFQTGS